MIEQYDALQRFNLAQLSASAALFLFFGILLEFVLRLGYRWSLNHGHPWMAALLNALLWQPLFWAILLGTVSPVLWTVHTITGWQRNTGAVLALVLISATVVATRLVNGLLQIMTLRRPSASVSLLKNLVRALGVSLVLAILLGYIFNIPFFVLLLAFAGSITGLTVLFQQQLKDLVSGISLTLSSRLGPGDWVQLPSGIEGKVLDIQWDVTIVRQLTNNIVVIANSNMSNEQLVNFSQPDTVLSVLVPVGVSYSSDLERVEEVTLEEATAVMQAINGTMEIEDPVIRYDAFADSSINFNVVLRAGRYEDQFVLRHEFTKRLHRRYTEEGIVIPFPIRTVQGAPEQPFTVVKSVESRETDPLPSKVESADVSEGTDQ